jgi:hypothetical protein
MRGLFVSAFDHVTGVHSRFRHVIAVIAAGVVLTACGGADQQLASEVPSGGSVDSQSPSVGISTPSANGSFSSSAGSVGLAGAVADNVGVAEVRWSNDRGGSGAAVVSGSVTSGRWSVAAVGLATGTNVITVTATDTSGNSANAQLVVSYGSAPTPGSGTGSGSTYYVDANASDDAGDGSSARPKKFITSGAALMSSAGGDTLIVRAGTYGNAKDAVGNLVSGKAGAWNVIKAEIDGTVTITAGLNLTLIDHFLQFEGIRWDSTSQKNITGRYVKMLRCAFRGGPASGNVMQLAIGTNDATPGAQYILLEDTFVYGPGGRYNVLVYNADRVLLRRVVARHQDGWTDTNGDPQAAVSLYNSSNVLTQNLLLVDSGATGYFEAALYHPSNSRPSTGIRNTGAIILNTTKGSGVGWDDAGRSSGNLLEDSVVWGAPNAITINGAAHAGQINRVTVGRSTSGGVNDWSGGGGFAVTNSVLWQLGGTNLSSIDHSGNDCFSPSCSGESSLNPASSGLLWLPRIEVGTALKTAGIGANVVYRLGKSGTLWGDVGYDQPTSEALWPWPNEAAVKKAMCTDSGVATGFCAKGSITQYVWEFLGAPSPASYLP